MGCKNLSMPYLQCYFSTAEVGTANAKMVSQQGECQWSQDAFIGTLAQINMFFHVIVTAWWCHQIETFSALLALCAGNSPVTGEFPSQRPVTLTFNIFFGLHLNKLLSKRLRRQWFEMPLCLLWRHCNECQQRKQQNWPVTKHDKIQINTLRPRQN